ncbi:MAG TPA: hypothetical protein GX405_00735 [Rhizobiales bacterium]|nr:hypothetical protein [Hyphomicrobiales bacterium]
MTRRLRVVIHGGPHKSGTTSFQTLMDASRDRLLEAGVYYPEGPKGQHAAILNTKLPSWQSGALRAAVEAARAAGAHTLLMSAEGVCSIGVAGFRRLAESLVDCDPIFAFVFRHWSTFLPSRWAQNCKRRDTQPLGAYVERVLSSDDHVDHRFDLVIGHCREGADAPIIAVSFDRALDEHGSVIPVLVDSLSLPPFLKGSAAANWSNPTPDRDAIELVRLLNGVVADRLELPQDDLFVCRGEHRRCETLFDAFAALRSLSAAQRGNLIDLGRGTQAELVFDADWRPPAADRLDRYAGLFVNAPDGAIFPARPARTERYWTLEWTEIADHPLFAGPIERATSAIRQKMPRPQLH